MLLVGDTEMNLDGNVAVIPIKGTIQVERSSGFGFQGTSSSDVVKLIKKADKKDDIKVILLDINSGGGSAVASAEIAQAVKSCEKPIYAVIREAVASGAFWIATSADNVFAHPLSVTGSVGVIASYLQFSGFIDDYNVTYERLVSGKYKDAGTPLKEMTDEENNPKEGLFSRTDDFNSLNELTNKHPTIHEIAIKNKEHFNDLIEITKKDNDIIPLFIKDNKGELNILSSYNTSTVAEISKGSKLVYLGKSFEKQKA